MVFGICSNLYQKLNTGSVSQNGVWLKASIAFSVIMFENNIPAIVANAKDIDLLGSFGISFFIFFKELP